ncbi:FxLD family lantipeptide [Saccharothrix ecbatanensis]|uniref:FxLD family lantipeptide n=1 Tax=Saccharothrix ecbatanensis TaxID=1105145 RepID=A0A7W9HUP3_9PSEU|nr:FxLD family lanthipeptide [Saccharothrix ecbatanensis]MBB5808832.1 FxLD family lantipeptide [Saccharothrix ecbatanensis]
MTVQMERLASAPIARAAGAAGVEADSEFDLDITLVEVVDPAHLINMTDDGCGTTCEKSTCITAA